MFFREINITNDDSLKSKPTAFAELIWRKTRTACQEEKGFVVVVWQKNEFERMEDFAHACAKFCKRIKFLESIPKK